ncbi:bifunctional diguanylate cyclase/phosphodiesterase [Robertmurraya siralis]|uniref:bifunctional diguanylate cyclase/phosphodiesterase n=1 Tax=Robertmurraya siralis TaxID=77777 RepID=UPI0010F66B25|nr:EAL domain-containing protein [Robertmurraya siralis]
MIKTISYMYKNANDLTKFIEDQALYEYPNIFIQLFANSADKEVVGAIQKCLRAELPLAHILGCTATAAIQNGRTVQEQISINFTVFERTELHSSLFLFNDYDVNEMGKKLAEMLTSFDTRALILFSTNHCEELSAVLNRFYHENPDVIVAGGVAVGDQICPEGFVFYGDKQSNHGIVAVSLNNPDLQMETFVNFKLQEIGKSFTITKASGNIIYAVDKKKPLQIIQRYLGKAFIEDIETLKEEFLFMLDTKGNKKGMRISKILESGAIEMNHPLAEGDKLVFAYADLPAIVDKSVREMKALRKRNVEAIFTYNCFSRRRILHGFADEELRILHLHAPTNGFFANGEIAYADGGPELIGQSFTYLALAENKVHRNRKNIAMDYAISDSLKTVAALTHLMKASQDDIKDLNAHLRISEQYYRSLFDNNADIVYSTDLSGNFTSVNPSFEKMFGYKEEELLGKSALKYISRDDIPRVRLHFFRAIKGKEQYYNIEINSKSGEKNLFHIKNIPITINGECVGIYGIGRNITEQKKIEDRIVQLAYFDQDTGLPNRIKFTEKLNETLQRAKKKKRHIAVLAIDLDRFKMINDSLGHDAGDEILKEISERIQDAIPSGAYLGRFSGDKFNLFLSKNVNMEEIIKVAKMILRKVTDPIHFSEKEFYITASIGISLFPNDGKDEITLLKNADIAMNRSKYPGGNRITLYSKKMNEEAFKRLELESYLRKALQKHEFFLCYQPLIDLKTGKLYGSEALIRWNHPVLGLVPPGDFIPLAEEAGLIEEIGSWVLKTACKQNKQWQNLGMEGLTVSVNVSANQFQQTKFVKEVKRALADAHLEPKYLTLELTESTMLRNIDHSIEVMKSLQKLGVRVSIDDFGTGYSSLSYLKDLPINTLKIDRSFINNLSLETTDIAIVKAIITMGYGLAVKVVAEGVETEEQIKLLKDLNCHYAQGFYLHQPLTAVDFEKMLLAKSIS